jgi:hypothetical protein
LARDFFNVYKIVLVSLTRPRKKKKTVDDDDDDFLFEVATTDSFGADTETPAPKAEGETTEAMDTVEQAAAEGDGAAVDGAAAEDAAPPAEAKPKKPKRPRVKEVSSKKKKPTK